MKFVNKIFTISLVLTIAIVMSGCDGDLTENVYSDTTEENYEYENADYKRIIGAVYTPLRSLYGGLYSHHMSQEITADAIVMPANYAGGWDDGGVYRRMHQQTWNSEQSHIGGMWQNYYQGVLHANRVLERIEEGQLNIPSSVGEDALIAEMRTMRAFYHWLILDNFGEAPLVESAEVGDGLPQKSSREVLYDFIVQEITESVNNLPESSGQDMYGRMNKWAAKSLLANVYLNAEVYVGEAEWDKVIEQADDIINSGQYSLENTYSDVFAEQNSDSPEIIFAIPFDEDQGTGFNIVQWAWHIGLKQKYQTDASPWGTGTARCVAQFCDTYDSEDSRLEETWIMGPQEDPNGDPIMGIFDDEGEQLDFRNEMPNGIRAGEAEGYRVKKFEVTEGAQSNLNNDFPIFRYAEVLMMKAEALLRTNRASEAASIVTDVRERAYKDNPSEATVTGSELQQGSKYEYGYVEDYEIVDEGDTSPIEYGRFLDELGWEFSWEGHRRRDLIRFGIFTEKSRLSFQPNGDYRTVFPIPQNVIDTNPEIEQHSDY